jgi:heavy metal translocating P-type ATPase
VLFRRSLWFLDDVLLPFVVGGAIAWFPDPVADRMERLGPGRVAPMTLANPPDATLAFPVQGMTCAACAGRVERALKTVPGVTSASVNLATERAEVLGQVPVSALIGAVEKAGYHVATGVQVVRIDGMTCASCVARVERALTAVPGVVSATVNLATEEARVDGLTPPEALIAAVKATGYAARIADAEAEETPSQRRDREAFGLRRDLILSAILTLPVFVMEMGGHVVPAFHHWLFGLIGQQTSWLIQFVLTTVVLAVPGRRFFAKGIPALFRGAPDMSSLVAVGAGAAWTYSTLATLTPSLLPPNAVAVYFEAAAMIVTLILLGRLLEARARGRSSQAIEQLIGLQPSTAHLWRDGQVVEVAVATLRPGDRIALRPGERVPVDGLVVEGDSWIDEAMVTGEPVPVAKAPGAAVIGGTVNQTGALVIEAQAVGADTLLAGIIRLVEAAQGGKLPIQALVDRVTLWFVPVVMALSVLTFLLWYVLGPAPSLPQALVKAVAVLIIACPCAMGLATPVAILVGTGRGAELGILFRKGEALQALQGVSVVAFDKTGTLTEGRPRLLSFHAAEGETRDALLPILAAVEAKSEHPVARAIAEAAADQSLPPVESFKAIPGQGVEARVTGSEIVIGSARDMARRGFDTAAFQDIENRVAGRGESPVYAARDGRVVALLAVADAVKSSTPDAIAALKAAGLRLAMISGDDARTARAIAEHLGIDEVVAEVTPEGKVDAVRRLKALGRLAFAGDGINDAPALAEADVGIAMGTGADVAIEAADVVLVGGRLPALAQAIGLSRATMTNIRQNLFWAFAYNVALIPVAAGALYPAFGIQLSPVLAAGAMALSSVFVLTNALRLRRFGRG